MVSPSDSSILPSMYASAAAGTLTAIFLPLRSAIVLTLSLRSVRMASVSLENPATSRERAATLRTGQARADEHVQITGGKRCRGLCSRRELLERDVEAALLEVALLDRDVERRVGDDAEVADLDRPRRRDRRCEQPHDEREPEHHRCSRHHGMQSRSSSLRARVLAAPSMVITMMLWLALI